MKLLYVQMGNEPIVLDVPHELKAFQERGYLICQMS